jgi:superfamily II DNA/RNA helicase
VGSGTKAKRAALRRLIDRVEVRSALVFCNRKREVSVVWRSLVRHGYSAGQLHGDMSQPARTETLAAFKRGEIRLLVCSDVAARGLDVQDMSHVFNFDVPTHAEDYIHRIGRTGRAGREGKAFTIALPEERKYLAAITRMLGRDIPRIDLAAIGAPPAAQPRAAEETPPEASADVPAERAAESKGRRRRRRPDDRSKPRQPELPPEVEASPIEPVEPRIKAEAPTKPEKLPAQRGRRSDADSREDDKPVRGLGDHVPAFLLRAVTPRPSAPDEKGDDADEIGNEDVTEAPTKPQPRKRAAAKPRTRSRKPAKKPTPKGETTEG